MQNAQRNSPKRFLEDPLVDRGEGIQALAKRHARLFLQLNIWRLPPAWLTPLQDQKVVAWYAFSLYCRLIRRYRIGSPLPDEWQPLDPMWLEIDPIVTARVQETDRQALARMLYIVAFTSEIVYYGSTYIKMHYIRWNNRIHELSQKIPRKQ